MFDFGIYGVQRPIYYRNKQGGAGVLRGGGIKGLAPQPVLGLDNNAEFEMTRLTLREVWNNNYVAVRKDKFGEVINPPNFACTPFRQKMNAGDVYTRVNYTCGGPCQTPQSIPGIASITNSIGAIGYNCDGTGIPPSACNVKYVYDSSNYTAFLKNQAINRNYNDLSYGGDQSNATFSVIQGMRRF